MSAAPASARRTRAGGRLRRAGLAAALAAASGCGFDAQTSQPYDPGDGTNVTEQGVSLLNAIVVDNADDTGTLSTTVVAGSEPTELTAVTATTLDGTEVPVNLVGPVDVSAPSGSSIRLGDDAVVTLDLSEVTDGTFLEMDFTFTGRPVIELQVPVTPRTEVYESVAEAPEVTPEAAPEAPEDPAAG